MCVRACVRAYALHGVVVTLAAAAVEPTAATPPDLPDTVEARESSDVEQTPQPGRYVHPVGTLGSNIH